MSEQSITLYRFLNSESALRTIEGRKMRVGRINEFNDPFEWRVGVVGVLQEWQEIAQQQMQFFIDEMNSSLGIMCFCDTVHDGVLWSHYADHHKGVAFEVDYCLKEESINKIEYLDERIVIDANQLSDPSKWDEYLKPHMDKLIQRKAKSWSYEREYRTHHRLSDCEISSGHYFTKIPDDFLKRVILGFRCPLEEAYIRKALDKVGLKDTEVVRASMDQGTYKILC